MFIQDRDFKNTRTGDNLPRKGSHLMNVLGNYSFSTNWFYYHQNWKLLLRIHNRSVYSMTTSTNTSGEALLGEGGGEWGYFNHLFQLALIQWPPPPLDSNSDNALLSLNNLKPIIYNVWAFFYGSYNWMTPFIQGKISHRKTSSLELLSEHPSLPKLSAPSPTPGASQDICQWEWV